MDGEDTSFGTEEEYPEKSISKIFYTRIVAVSGGLIFGYNVGISGGVTTMDPFLEKFFPEVYKKKECVKPLDDPYCKFNSQKLTFFTSSLYLAAILSSMIAFRVTCRLGRRRTMMFGGLLSTMGAIVNGFAANILMLIIGRVLLGFGIGFSNQSVPIYLFEMAPCQYRRALNFMFQLSITSGILVANLLNYLTLGIQGNLGWRINLGGGVVPALIFLFNCFFLSDHSPISLLQYNKFLDAKAQLREICFNDKVDEEDFNDLAKLANDLAKLASDAAAKLVEKPWTDIILSSSKYRPQLMFAILIPMFQQLIILHVFIFNSPLMYKSMGFNNHTSLESALFSSTSNFIGGVFFIILIDKMDNKELFLSSFVQVVLGQVLMYIAMAWKGVTSGSSCEVPPWFPTTIMICIHEYMSGVIYFWGPFGWLVPSQIWPVEMRSAGQSVTVGVNMMFSFCFTHIFTVMLCYLKFGIFIFFAYYVVVMSLFVSDYLPETKGFYFIDVWHNHPYWTRFDTSEEDDSIFKTGKMHRD